MNAFAFAAQASNPWMLSVAVTLRVASRPWCSLTKVGALMWIDTHSRTA
jgi:hypothetical protein